MQPGFFSLGSWFGAEFDRSDSDVGHDNRDDFSFGIVFEQIDGC